MHNFCLLTSRRGRRSTLSRLHHPHLQASISRAFSPDSYRGHLPSPGCTPHDLQITTIRRRVVKGSVLRDLPEDIEPLSRQAVLPAFKPLFLFVILVLNLCRYCSFLISPRKPSCGTVPREKRRRRSECGPFSASLGADRVEARANPRCMCSHPGAGERIAFS